MEYDEPITRSLHQFLMGSSNLKAAAASDCCVAIEFASKLMQNGPIFFAFTASKIYPKMMHNELENELCRRYIKKKQIDGIGLISEHNNVLRQIVCSYLYQF